MIKTIIEIKVHKGRCLIATDTWAESRRINGIFPGRQVMPRITGMGTAYLGIWLQTAVWGGPHTMPSTLSLSLKTREKHQSIFNKSKMMKFTHNTPFYPQGGGWLWRGWGCMPEHPGCLWGKQGATVWWADWASVLFHGTWLLLNDWRTDSVVSDMSIWQTCSFILNEQNEEIQFSSKGTTDSISCP